MQQCIGQMYRNLPQIIAQWTAGPLTVCIAQRWRFTPHERVGWVPEGEAPGIWVAAVTIGHLVDIFFF